MLHGLLLTTLFAILPSDAYKILVFSPTISRSHMISNGRIADALAKDGHNVTLLEVEYDVSPDAVETAKYARRLKVYGPFLPHKQSQEQMKALSTMIFTEQSFLQRLVGKYMMPVWHFGDVMNRACEEFVLRKDVVEHLKTEKFDVYMGEQLISCGTLYSHLLGIKTHVWISSCPMMEHMSSVLGVPMQSSYVRGVMFSDGYSDRMSYFERVGNLLETTVNYLAFRKIRDMETATFRKHFGSDFPHADDIAKESALTLVSVDEFTDFPRPILHNQVYIGGLGLHESSPKPLEEPFKSELEKGAEGVVFVSFGSIMPTKHFPEAVRSNVIGAMAELPQFHFILKMDKGDEVTDALARNYSNIFTTSWAPQPQILAHPRIRVFATHGGYNSLIEAARHGVPLLLTGFFADQMRNARVVERNGWGIAFDKHDLKKSHVPFKEAIRTLVENETYAEKARRTQKLILTKPFTAEERLTKWMRFLEANGGHLPELMSEGRNLTTVAFYNLDIYVPFVCILLVVVFLFARALRFGIPYAMQYLTVDIEKKCQ